MKNPLKIIIGAAIIIGSAFYAITQEVERTNQEQDNALFSAAAYSSPINPLRINLETWELINPEGDQDKIAHLNTPEERQKRQERILAILNPRPPGDKANKSPEQIELEERARFAIENPTWEEAPKTPEEAERDRRARWAIENPVLPQ